ncbi:MAG: hypothetical protein N2323_05190, partial [candidate division WOR-3 bacterium]|nr:hypothetical protein [candidate division WOR-3 bacterium]
MKMKIFILMLLIISPFLFGESLGVRSLGFFDTPGYARGVFIVYPYAYVSDGESGLLIIDISDPTHPQLVGQYDTPDNAYEVYI